MGMDASDSGLLYNGHVALDPRRVFPHDVVAVA